MKLIPPRPIKKLNEEEVQFTDKLSSYDKFLIFSPHFDDAVLSTGSLLTYLVELGKNIKVINVFTQGSQVVSSLNQQLIKQAQISNAKDYFLTRRNEDKKAFEKLGNVALKNLDFIDAAWREGEDQSPLYPEVIGEIHRDDNNLVRQLEEQSRKIADNLTNALIFAPLARGRHVDHQIVRKVVTKVFEKVIYYSDFPYSQKYGDEQDFIKDHNLTFIDWHGDYTKKIELILNYKSQLFSSFQLKDFQLPFERFYSQIVVK